MAGRHSWVNRQYYQDPHTRKVIYTHSYLLWKADTCCCVRVISTSYRNTHRPWRPFLLRGELATKEEAQWFIQDENYTGKPRIHPDDREKYDAFRRKINL